MRLRINLGYDGTDFKGWQLQPGDTRTVQGELEKTIGQLFGNVRRLRVIVAGRTDAGVHAAGQVCHVDTPENLEVEEIEKGLRALLPGDVQIWRVRRTFNHFHARYWARERVYVYRILKKPDVFLQRFGWCPEMKFDPARAAELTDVFLGRYNFKPFTTKLHKGDDPICEVKEVNFIETPDCWLFQVRADRFLRRMVRALVSTLVYMAAEKLDPDEVREVITSGIMTKEAWERYKREHPLIQYKNEDKPDTNSEGEAGTTVSGVSSTDIIKSDYEPAGGQARYIPEENEDNTGQKSIHGDNLIEVANNNKGLSRPVAPPAPPQGLALVRVRYDIDDEFDTHSFSTWRIPS